MREREKGLVSFCDDFRDFLVAPQRFPINCIAVLYGGRERVRPLEHTPQPHREQLVGIGMTSGRSCNLIGYSRAAADLAFVDGGPY